MFTYTKSKLYLLIIHMRAATYSVNGYLFARCIPACSCDIMPHCTGNRLWISAVGFPETPVPASVTGRRESSCLCDVQDSNVQGSGWCGYGGQTTAPKAWSWSWSLLPVCERTLSVCWCAGKSFWWINTHVICMLCVMVTCCHCSAVM